MEPTKRSIIKTMKDLPLNALYAFATVYATGGIRAAAGELGVAHSAVSRHLKELEAGLGVTLTHRPGGRQGLVFTPQGKALGKATLENLDAIRQTVRSLREARNANSVMIATTASFASRWLLPRLPKLEAARPEIETSVLVDQQLGNPGNGDADFAIRMGAGPWPDLHCEPLLDDSLYPVMAPSFWRTHGQPRKPAGLIRLRLLHDRDPQAGWSVWKDRYGPASLDVDKGPRFASSDLLLRAAAQGQGVVLARHQLAREEVSAGLLMRPMGERCVDIGPSYWLVKPKHVPIRPAVATVIDWLKEEA